MTATRLRSDVAWGLALEAGRLGAMLVAFALLSRRLGPVGFGAYAAIYGVIAVLGGLVGGGLSLSLFQHVVRDDEARAEIVRSQCTIALASGVLCSIVGTLVASLVTHGVAVVTVACFVVAELLASVLVEVGATTVHAVDGLAPAARLRALLPAAKATTLVVLWLAGWLRLAVLGPTLVAVCSLVALVVVRGAGRRYGFAVRPGRPHGAHVRSGLQYSTVISAVALQNDGDKVVMSADGLGAQVGRYAAAYRVVQVGLLPLMALMAATHRRFVEHGEGRRGHHVRTSVRFAAASLAYALAVAAALVVAAPLVPRLLGPQYDDAVPMVRALSLLVVIRSTANFPLNGLIGLGRLSARTLCALASAVVALALYVALVPPFGWRGAFVGTVVSEAVLSAAAWGALVHYQRVADRRTADDATGPVLAPSA